MKLVVFLQNAWSPFYAGRRWRRTSWLKALDRSRTGYRLRFLQHACNVAMLSKAFDSETNLVEPCVWWFDNTTPICGGHPSSIVPADLEHMWLVLQAQNPDKVICMGKQAWRAMIELKAKREHNIPVLFTPHPAYRVLTDRLLFMAADLVAAKWEGTKELKQLRGEVCCVP